MKIAIVGAGISGIHAAIALRKKHPSADITLYEAEAQVAYVPSSLSQVLKQETTKLDDLQFISPSELKQKYQINIHTKCLITGLIDPHHLQVNHESVFFDYLILAFGADQTSYNLKQLQVKKSRVFTFKRQSEATIFLEELNNFEKIAVIGAGPVGLEITEGLRKQKKAVTIFDTQKYPLFKLIDQQLGTLIISKLKQQQVATHFNENIIKIQENKNSVQLTSTKAVYQFDAVLLAVNIRPKTTVWQPFIKTNPDQTIIVNDYLQTNYSHIYAIGDVIQSYFKPLDKHIYPALASNAIRTAHLVAQNIPQTTTKDTGTLRVSQHYLFGYHIFQAGLTEKEAILAPNDIELMTKKEAQQGHWIITKRCLDSKSKAIIGILVISTDSINSLKFDWLKELNHGLKTNSTEVPFSVLSPKFIGEMDED